MLSHLIPSVLHIDWSQTRAFAVGTWGAHLLQCWRKRATGNRRDEEEYENVRNLIIKKLESPTDPKTGNEAIEKVFSKEEPHTGSFFDRAPDISFLPGRGFGTLQREQFVSPSTFIDSPSCGTHRINGIMLLFGPNINSNKQIKEAKIFHLAPTILHIFGLPVPDNKDGRVLKEIFKEGSGPNRREIIFQEVSGEERKRSKKKIRALKI